MTVLGLLLRRLARWSCFTAAFLSLLWLLGRLLNDRWHWSQYLYWAPAWLALFVALGTGPCWLAARTPGRRARRPSTLWLLPGAVCLTMILWEWRLWRVLAPPSPAQGVRIAAWNPATDFIDDFAQRVASLSPAIVAIANRPAYTKWEIIREAVGGAGATARWGRLSLVSRYAVLRWGGTSLGITGSRPQLSVWKGGSLVSIDRGEAMFVELDTTRELGRPIVVWFVDMPSDPLIARQGMFGQARAALREFKGPAFVRTSSGLDEPLVTAAGFPEPDLVIGDFNTPRGSESIRRLVGAMTDAHHAAGCGPALTWHRRGAILGLDQAFVSPSLTPTAYRVKDMGAGQHLAQIVEIRARE